VIDASIGERRRRTGKAIEREEEEYRKKKFSETHSVYKWQQFSLDKDYISKRARQIKKKHTRTLIVLLLFFTFTLLTLELFDNIDIIRKYNNE
jgi:hypothetical protein